MSENRETRVPLADGKPLVMSPEERSEEVSESAAIKRVSVSKRYNKWDVILNNNGLVYYAMQGIKKDHALAVAELYAERDGYTNAGVV